MERLSILEGLEDPTCSLQCCEQFESEICADATGWTDAIPFAMQMLMIIVLLSLSALFAGLTLGFLSLDMTGLEIVMEGDDPIRAESARQVLTVRKNGNLLLCTLIFGNVGVNSFLSILMGQCFGGMIGLIASTASIVVFAEILPQAICARYALEIGSRSVPLVKAIICLFYPVAYPLSFCLNKLLGNELPTTYSNSEMRKLLQIHVEEGRFDAETADAMTGALKYKDLTVQEVMTSIENTFMLNVDEKLSFQTIAKIFKTGYSRIPVYEVTPDNVIGLLFVKDLIFVEPEVETSVRTFVQIFGREVHAVRSDDKLGDILRELKKGKSHLALVRDRSDVDKNMHEIKGIITLEDIIEEIIGDEIVDETDAFVDGTQSVKVNRSKAFDWGRLALLNSKIVAKTLSREKVNAVTAHLRTHYADSFALLTDEQLQLLVAETDVDELPAVEHEIGRHLPDNLLYTRSVEANFCTLILSGKIAVIAGADEFRSDVSSWTVLGARVFQESPYMPDFTAFVTGGPCRCLRITKSRFSVAVLASTVENTSKRRSERVSPAIAAKREARRSELLAVFRSKSSFDERGERVRDPVIGVGSAGIADANSSKVESAQPEESKGSTLDDSLLSHDYTTGGYGTV